MVNEASHFSDLPEILNFIPNKVEVIRFDTRASKGRAINSLNISYRQDRPRLDEARTGLHTMRSHSRHDAVMRQIELITSREYLLYAMLDDNRSNEELTSGGGIRPVCMITTLRNYTNCAAFQRNFAVRVI